MVSYEQKKNIILLLWGLQEKVRFVKTMRDKGKDKLKVK